MSNLVFAGWRALLQRNIQTAREGVFTVLSSLRTSANGAFEALTGAPAPGRSWSAVMAHDHTESGGGAVLPRGVIWNCDNGIGDGWEWSVPNTAVPLGTPVSYFYDFANAADTRRPTFYCPVTDGIHSLKLNLLSSDCALEGRLIVFIENDYTLGSNTIDFRIFNEDTQTASSTQQVTIGTGSSSKDVVQVSFGDIPLNTTSGWHRYTLEVACDHQCTLRVQSLVIAETRETSQPATAGQYRYNSVSATTRN